MTLARALALALALAPSLAPAADAAPGRAKAQPCAPCHGAWGLSAMPDAPNLAGQPRVYLVSQLKAFRSGKRQHEVMSVIAKPLSDADIEELADWFSSLALEVKGRP